MITFAEYEAIKEADWFEVATWCYIEHAVSTHL